MSYHHNSSSTGYHRPPRSTGPRGGGKGRKAPRPQILAPRLIPFRQRPPLIPTPFVPYRPNRIDPMIKPLPPPFMKRPPRPKEFHPYPPPTGVPVFGPPMMRPRPVQGFKPILKDMSALGTKRKLNHIENTRKELEKVQKLISEMQQGGNQPNWEENPKPTLLNSGDQFQDWSQIRDNVALEEAEIDTSTIDFELVRQLNDLISSSVQTTDSISDNYSTENFAFSSLEDLEKVDLTEPEDCGTGWNASEIIKDFLYIGSGHDKNQRCLVNNPYKLYGEDKYATKRAQFVMDKNIKFFLNMAADPRQKELVGISYPGSERYEKAIPLNDVDSWSGDEMKNFLEEGALFIQQAYYVHLGYKQGFPKNESVKILVHCVAGVNRSAFVVVWWLVRYQGLFLKDAWNLVVERRDAGVNWVNQTLGGEIDDDIEDLFPEIEDNPRKFYTLDRKDTGTGHHQQHLIENVYTTTSSSNTEKLGPRKNITIDFLDNSGSVVVYATEVNVFPKYLWYKQANKLLSKYFTVHYP